MASGFWSCCILRARYREGIDKARPVEPGRVYEYEINVATLP